MGRPALLVVVCLRACVCVCVCVCVSASGPMQIDR